ncbi:MAG: hypothetical protein GY794_13915 [bacterium]|nr:hypothetical protein [bacterium]
MIINNASSLREQSCAIVHKPQAQRTTAGRPMRVVARRVEQTIHANPLNSHCADQYQQHARAYFPEVPAIVFDVKM